MRTHAALLRGINVGGNNKVPMKDLRLLIASLGYGDVETYIQSGNVVLSSDSDAEDIRASLERAVAEQLGVSCAVVVVTREELAGVVAGNPFPADDDRRLHVVFRSSPFGVDDLEAVDRAVARARAKGSRDEVSVAEKTMYLWTPDGYGRSELAAQLSRAGTAGGTARNWATVSRLMEMLES
ncbi:MAG TPA: DUF1697 domain-containing protein [Acidimicrobiales bacterium]|nr:DUF1697 domain-containing protein [Acidimicrobiales bacterium]